MNKGLFYEFGDFRLDAERRRLFRLDDEISLPPKAIELLVLLIENQGSVVEKELIMDALWQDTFVEEGNLTQTIYLLRKALGKDGEGKPLIVTFAKKGYKFLPPVEKMDGTTFTQTSENRLAARPASESVLPTETHLHDSLQKIRPGAMGYFSSFSRQRPVLLLMILFTVFLGVAGMIGSKSLNTGKPSEVRTIGVMPFNFIGGSDDQAFVSMGLTDSLITSLGQSGKIEVRSAEQVQRFFQNVKEPLEVGRLLAVDAVMIGNLQRNGDQLRFNAQLLRVSDGQILWANQFDESSANLFALQDAVARSLNAVLSENPSGQGDLAKRQTENLEAYKLYWQGRFYWNKRTPEMIRKGITFFEEAIRLDPNYARAYAGLADSYVLTVSGFPAAGRFPKAKAAAERAIELDETLAEAHTSLAFVLARYDQDWPKAASHFERSIELDNSYATARHWYGEMLTLNGFFDQGLDQLRTAEKLDPFSIAIKTDLAEALYRSRRYDEAVAQCRKVLESDPNHLQTYRVLRNIYRALDSPELIPTDLQVMRLSDVSAIKVAEFEKLFASRDSQKYWLERLELFRTSDKKKKTYFLELPAIYLSLGQHTQAVKELQRMIDHQETIPTLLKTDPVFDPLRSDSSFQILANRTAAV